jgi:hypothetical protein
MYLIYISFWTFIQDVRSHRRRMNGSCSSEIFKYTHVTKFWNSYTHFLFYYELHKYHKHTVTHSPPMWPHILDESSEWYIYQVHNSVMLKLFTILSTYKVCCYYLALVINPYTSFDKYTGIRHSCEFYFIWRFHWDELH